MNEDDSPAGWPPASLQWIAPLLRCAAQIAVVATIILIWAAIYAVLNPL